MKRLLWCVLILGGSIHTAAAQTFPAPLNQYAIDQQVSGQNVSNFVFTSSRKTLYTLTSLTGASSGFVIVFDASALPSNGAVTACASSATARPCVMWCAPVNSNSFISAQWLSPLQFTTGVVAGFSTGADCSTLTASATSKFMGQAP